MKIYLELIRNIHPNTNPNPKTKRTGKMEKGGECFSLGESIKHHSLWLSFELCLNNLYVKLDINLMEILAKMSIL